MIPLLTTTPNRIRNPVSVFAFIRLLLESNNASKEPIAANGMVNISTMGAVVDSNTAAKKSCQNKEFEIPEFILLMEYLHSDSGRKIITGNQLVDIGTISSQ